MPHTPSLCKAFYCTVALASMASTALAQETRDESSELEKLQSKVMPTITPTAQLQTWATLFDQDETSQADGAGPGDPEADVGFNLARGRIGLRGGYRWVDFNFLAGTSSPFDAVTSNPPPFDIVSAWVRTTFEGDWGKLGVRVGQHQVPFSREMGISSNDLVFQERAVSTNYLSPNRDLGASLRYDYKGFGISTGVYNGNGSNYGDVDPGVLVAARVEGSMGGNSYRTNDEEDAFGIGASYIYNQTFATTEHRISADFLGRYKGFNVLAEGGIQFINPDLDADIVDPEVSEQTTRYGFMAQLSYFRDVGLGAIEPAVRFSLLNDAVALQDAGDVAIIHGGISWREPVPFIDIGALYIHRMEFTTPRANDTVRMFVGFRYPSRNIDAPRLEDLFRSLSK